MRYLIIGNIGTKEIGQNIHVGVSTVPRLSCHADSVICGPQLVERGTLHGPGPRPILTSIATHSKTAEDEDEGCEGRKKRRLWHT